MREQATNFFVHCVEGRDVSRRSLGPAMAVRTVIAPVHNVECGDSRYHGTKKKVSTSLCGGAMSVSQHDNSIWGTLGCQKVR